MARNRFSLSLDHRRLSEIINRHIHAGMERAANRLVDVMEKEIVLTNHGDGPGRPEWRREMLHHIHIAFRKIAASEMEYGVGIVPDDLKVLIKASIIGYGAGSAAGNAPIAAGPYGRMVFDDNLDQKPSESHSEYFLPDGFNQPGNDWLNNSMEIIKKEFNDFIVNAWLGIPESELAQCIKFEVR